MFVVVAGDPFDTGLTAYGPFVDHDEAVEWVEGNVVTDLSSVPWWVVPLERTTDEDEDGQLGGVAKTSSKR